MALVKWTESPIENMERMFLDTMDDLDNRLAKRFGVANNVYVPNLDISEDKDNFYVIAELPGLDEEDVKVTVDNDLLTISGKKERSEEKEEQNYYRVERSFGQFARSMSLPSNVGAKAITGSFKNGLLELTLPKIATNKATVREIPLTTAHHVTQDGHGSAKNGSRKAASMRSHA